MSQSQIRTRTSSRLSISSRTGDETLVAGVAVAISLHVLVFLALMFTFARLHPLDISDESAPVVPVDLVTIAPKTNIIPQVQKQPTPAPQVTPQPIVQPKVAPPVPQEDTEPAPDTAPSEPKVTTPPPPPVPVPRPHTTPQPEAKKQPADNLNALLNKVLSGSSAPPNARISNRNTSAFGNQTAMTADLQDALRSQIRPCWSPPVGAPHPEQLVVDFDLFLNPDGSVAQAPQLSADSASTAASNPYVRAAADAARRAIYECAPYKLPADKYALWREINPFRFDPRQMVGQ